MCTATGPLPPTREQRDCSATRRAEQITAMHTWNVRQPQEDAVNTRAEDFTGIATGYH